MLPESLEVPVPNPLGHILISLIAGVYSCWVGYKHHACLVQHGRHEWALTHMACTRCGMRAYEIAAVDAWWLR